MKKILSILGTITLIGTSTTSLIACNTKYTETELKELKEENKININGNTLEWIAPQERPFNQTDNKWYFVIWRGNKNDDWKIVKFRHSHIMLGEKIDKYNDYYILELWQETNYPYYFTLAVGTLSSFSFGPTNIWTDDNGTYFKAVYRWDGDGEPKTLIIDPKTGEVTYRKEDKEVKKDK